MDFNLTSTPKIEEEYRKPWEAYKADPSPINASRMLKSLNPVLSRGVNMYAGKNAAPTTRSHARRLALQALKTYDPEKVKLGTHVTNHLKGLRRVQRQQGHILKTPERVMLDRGYVEQSRTELEDRLGREPSDQELADASGLSVKRIEYIRLFSNPMSQGMLDSWATVEGGSQMAPAIQQGGPSDIWLRAIASDLSATDQKILEWTTGLGGSPIYNNQQIARKLRLSPGAISQRKARIQKLIDQETAVSPFIRR